MDIAKEIVTAMDCLPLAIDQAGAYLAETRCGLSDYLEQYRTETERATLLKQRGNMGEDHPEAVATTWSSFKKVKKANPAAAELLQFCAFLSPDAIPLQVIIEGSPALGSVLGPAAASKVKLNDAIGELLKYSLVQRDPNAGILTIHRLVQVVIKDAMDEDTQYQWVERGVRVLDKVLSTIDFKVWGKSWRQCEQYLPHAQVCAAFIKQWNIASLEAAQLLYRTGSYLCDSGQYEQAEVLLQHALTIRKKVLGEQHRDTARSFSYLAMAYQAEGRDTEVESLLQRALTIQQKVLGIDPRTARSLNCLALFYMALNDYEKVGSPEYAVAVKSSLADVYASQGKYDQAEPYYLQSLDLYQKTTGPNHPYTLNAHNGLAKACAAQAGRQEGTYFLLIPR